jgi:hypothetical protein
MTMTAMTTSKDVSATRNLKDLKVQIVRSPSPGLTLASSHRATPRRSTSASNSDDNDFGLRPSKRRRISKGLHKVKEKEIVLPAERTSSRLGAKVVNYNEDEDDSIDEDDLMPNEFGEVWTYGRGSCMV